MGRRWQSSLEPATVRKPNTIPTMVKATARRTLPPILLKTFTTPISNDRLGWARVRCKSGLAAQ